MTLAYYSNRNEGVAVLLILISILPFFFPPLLLWSDGIGITHSPSYMAYLPSSATEYLSTCTCSSVLAVAGGFFPSSVYYSVGPREEEEDDDDHRQQQ